MSENSCNVKSNGGDYNTSYLEKIEKKHGSLIPVLQATQQKFGFLPEPVMNEIAVYLDISLTGVYGVATFYSQFRFEPLGKYVVKVCHGTACHVNDSVNISQAMQDELGIQEGQTTDDGLVTFERVACLGCCSLAPVIMVNDLVFGRLTPDRVRKIIQQIKEGEL